MTKVLIQLPQSNCLKTLCSMNNIENLWNITRLLVEFCRLQYNPFVKININLIYCKNELFTQVTFALFYILSNDLQESRQPPFALEHNEIILQRNILDTGRKPQENFRRAHFWSMEDVISLVFLMKTSCLQLHQDYDFDMVIERP